MSHRETQQLWRQLRRQGFTVELTGRGHYRITHPAMASPIFGPATPSDSHSLRNLKAKLRRAFKGTLT